MIRLNILIVFWLLISCSNSSLTNSSLIEPDFSALKKAIITNNFELVQRFIKKGISLNKFDENGETPLIFASRASSVDEKMLNLLVNSGADLFYESPITYATPM